MQNFKKEPASTEKQINFHQPLFLLLAQRAVKGLSESTGKRKKIQRERGRKGGVGGGK